MVVLFPYEMLEHFGCGWMTIAGMIVLMCWDMRTTICLGFVPRKRFMRDKICYIWHLVPFERFRWNEMVFALRLVLFERISGTNPFNM